MMLKQRNSSAQVNNKLDPKKWHQFSHLIFTNNDRQLSEEASQACFVSGINPKDLIQKHSSGDVALDKLNEKKR